VKAGRNRRLRRAEKADANKRTLWIAVFLCVWMLVIIGRLAWLQVVRREHYLGMAALHQQKEVKTVPLRGEIVDREGREMAISLFTESVYADLKLLNKDEDRRKAAQKLAPLLGMMESDLLGKLSGNSSFVWIKRKLDPDASKAVREAISAGKLHGVAIQKETQRYYPNDSLASHLVGYVDAYDAGLGGIEQKFNDLLNGKPGVVEFDEDARGRAYNRREIPALNGARIIMTIDSVLQHKVEVLLDEAVRISHAKGAGAIVLDPRTGEILALASLPSFNPNERPKTADDRNRHNRAISWPYEPGSVFKMVSYAAAFEEGLIKPEDRINCGAGEVRIGKRVIRDTKAYGVLSVEDAFAKSSNVCAIRIAQNVGREKLFDYIARFGFGRKTGIELPGESRGIVNPLTAWRIDSIGSVAIGQEVSITLLQGVAAMGAIANRGVWVRPRIVKQIVTQDGRVAYEPKVETRQVVSERTAALTAGILERVVTHGTARHAIKLNGYTAAGKTGTPQKVDERTRAYSQTKFMPSFAGFVPANEPRFAIIVMVDEPVGLHQGGSVAAPIFNMIAEVAIGDYAIPPDDKRFREALVALSEKYESQPDEDADRNPAAAAPIEVQPGPEPKNQADSKTAGPAEVRQERKMEPARVASATGSVSSLPGRASSAPTAKPATATPKTPPGQPVATYVMPDFRGRGVRAVAQACAQMKLVIRLHGSGVAVRQSPAAGAKVRAGDICKVEFQ
jgi:cell division protein FtsI (penicillin-binding protein 3)